MLWHDFLGTVFSLLSTYYFTKASTKAWPLGIVANMLNASLYWKNGIYVASMLECFYLVTALLGWYWWTKQSHSLEGRKITHITWRQSIVSLAGISIGFCVFYLLLVRYTDSTVPVLDALTTSLSLAGQWMMCFKIITTWIVWFIVDSLYAGLYVIKYLPFHVALMLVYLIFAVVGYKRWQALPH